MTCPDCFRHECHLPPGRERRAGARWTCPVCRQEWAFKRGNVASSKGDGHEGVIAIVVMRYQDGTSAEFGVLR